jgi:hypothetical protein
VTLSALPIVTLVSPALAWKSPVGAYSARTTCSPAVSVGTSIAAVPSAASACSPTGPPSTENATVPVGVAGGSSVAVTVAVSWMG